MPGLPAPAAGRPGHGLRLLSKGRKDVAACLERQRVRAGDRRFNNLNGDRQMYFNAPSGRPIDVMVNRLTMCHTLDFRPGFGSLPLTVDAVDVLLSKLQIVELNEKDAWDTVQLLSGLPLPGGRAGTPAAGSAAGHRHRPVRQAARRGLGLVAHGHREPGQAARAGWRRTPRLLPPEPPFDPLAQARQLAEIAEAAPKGMKWKMRANVGDRVRWYELPEEVAH